MSSSVCSYKSMLLGTWNADPNHIDYIPTRGMNNLNYNAAENGAKDASSEPYTLDASMNDSLDSFNQHQSNGASHHHDLFSNNDSSFHDEASPNLPGGTRVPMIGLGSSQFSSGKSSMSASLKMKSRRKQPKTWSSSPKLTSSHFCEHNG